MVLILATAVALTAGTVVALAPRAAEVFTASSSEATDIALDSLCQRSYIRSSNGTLLATLHGEENREPVTLDEIPQAVIDAILAVEDQDFYSHNGINLRATLRALLENVDTGEVSQGGSTITQQLVKLSLVGDKQDLDRKTREAFLATRLEEQMSKDEILERYLNTVYFGNGTYGVQAAAEYYFGIDVTEMDAGQAALLAAIIRNPRDYNPFENPEVATERRDIALNQMYELGNIVDGELLFFQTRPIPEQPTVVAKPPDDYFLEEVKQQLLGDARLGETYSDRFDAVFCGGIDVVSTIDLEAQFLAIAARNEVIAPFEDPSVPGTFPLPAAPDGSPQFGTVAITSVEPSTGAVRAMVGGPGFDAYKYNLATQGSRQPGSSFKTFVLMSLLDQGYSPNDTVSGSGPCTFNIPGVKEPYKVENFGNGRGGVGTITSQTLKSSNCAYVRLGQVAGLDNVMDLAAELGITTPLDPSIFSAPLGSLEVKPVDMAAAYSVIFNDGVRNPAYYIESVTAADGSLIFQHQADPREVVSVEAALQAQNILKQNVQSGTGTRARIPGWDVGGKTGTAQDSADAWFVGGTKELATAVWMGSPQGRVALRGVGGITVTGGSWPASIWGEYMGNYHAVRQPIPFGVPPRAERGEFLKLDPKIDKAGSRPPVRSGSSRGSTPASGPTPTTADAPATSVQVVIEVNPPDSGD